LNIFTSNKKAIPPWIASLILLGIGATAIHSKQPLIFFIVPPISTSVSSVKKLPEAPHEDE
jgi:hypothetical protein